MAKKKDCSKYHYFIPPGDRDLVSHLGKEFLTEVCRRMLRIRHFEMRAEGAYLQGKIGGFFHAYTGQEAIQTACQAVFHDKTWWSTTYRCHALALLLGVSPEEAMSELFGKANGNALGRGGSMHLYTDRLLGGFGIVGGQIPVALGPALTAKYLNTDEISICFLGEGAVAQGLFHESLNLAALWNLPCLFVIENNRWGMGTAVSRAIASEPIAEKFAPCYGIDGYTVDGMDFFACYAAFEYIREKIRREKRPVLVETVTERFKGHSISDPAAYRSKEALQEIMKRDPVTSLKETLIRAGFLDEEGFKRLDREARDQMIASVKHAEESPVPNPVFLEEGVYKEEKDAKY